MKRPMQPTVNCEPDNMSNYDLTAYLNDKKELINNELDKIFRNLPNSSHIVKAMKYSLMAGGKRIRPILCLASAEAVGSDQKAALPAACTFDMIRTYTSILDD